MSGCTRDNPCVDQDWCDDMRPCKRESESDQQRADKLDEPEHHDPLLRHLTDWTRQVGEQPRERVAMGIAAAAREFHAKLKALPTSTRFTQSAGTRMTREAFSAAFIRAIDRQAEMVAHTPGWKSLLELVWEEIHTADRKANP